MRLQSIQATCCTSFRTLIFLVLLNEMYTFTPYTCTVCVRRRAHGTYFMDTIFSLFENCMRISTIFSAFKKKVITFLKIAASQHEYREI